MTTGRINQVLSSWTRRPEQTCKTRRGTGHPHSNINSAPYPKKERGAKDMNEVYRRNSVPSVWFKGDFHKAKPLNERTTRKIKTPFSSKSYSTSSGSTNDTKANWVKTEPKFHFHQAFRRWFHHADLRRKALAELSQWRERGTRRVGTASNFQFVRMHIVYSYKPFALLPRYLKNKSGIDGTSQSIN